MNEKMFIDEIQKLNERLKKYEEIILVEDGRVYVKGILGVEGNVLGETFASYGITGMEYDSFMSNTSLLKNQRESYIKSREMNEKKMDKRMKNTPEQELKKSGIFGWFF